MAALDVSKLRKLPGHGFPLGATVGDRGVHFALVSRHATRVWLALFEGHEATEPAIEFELDPSTNRIGDVWSVYIEGLKRGALYMYRLDGLCDPPAGYRYHSEHYVLDPYAKLIAGNVQKFHGKSVVVDEERNWTPHTRPRINNCQSVIYETHVRGFTVHKSSGVKHKGSYLGLIEKIPYLKELGVTAVELMPVQEVGELELDRANPLTGEKLKNYWGYAPIGFFAPAGRFGSRDGTGEQLKEFRQLVSALHEAGLEVIMDVVFNHTAEGSDDGPSLCFRGIDNAIYYLLDERGECLNFTGCGNTVNCNHPLVRDLILDCLRYWTTVMRVDGFRFDLASVLGRDRTGTIQENAPVIERIAEDPVLRDVKLIAEAWDVGGAYQVGSFGGDDRWAELNGCFRDGVRKFWLTPEPAKEEFALRITGSPDLYQDDERTPGHSVNFITSHDGFTLRDLVSYNRKHNKANGENGRDGLDYNTSWNCGEEGQTEDPAINALRLRMQKNLLATLFLSLGTPMLLGGDEFSRTQQGNNNAYCQDNEISWFDWTLLRRNRDLFRFCKEIIAFRHAHPVFVRDAFFSGEPVIPDGQPDILWLNACGEPLDWNAEHPFVGLWINGLVNNGVPLYLAFNPSPEPVEVTPPGEDWSIALNTNAASPEDIPDGPQALSLPEGTSLQVRAHSLVVLVGVDA